MRKISLIAAALLMAFVFYGIAVRAADEAAVETVGTVGTVDAVDGACYCPPVRQSFGPMGQRGQRGMMMRQRWGGNDGRDDRGGRRWGGFNRGERDERDGRGDRDNRGMQRGGAQFGMMGSGLMEQLDLTDEQKKQMIDVAVENFRERLTLRWEMEEARATLRDLEESDSDDYEAIIAANEALGSARGKLDVARMRVAERFGAVLTDEQRATIEELQAAQEEEDQPESAE